ncbi:flagellar filament capping protein FliD [Metabacillus halosaccharovorans]|uniref:flagellar filament capping protein FliD n=1 Tax=Bacillaceae TaxID=186817 RepID=UPI00047DFE7B|nr:flagellar filament capping protein FliD [Bacillus sp. J37]
MVRIGGLASGMDIDTMVSELMKAERLPLDKLKQKKQTLEWQRDGYRELNSLLLSFRNLTFDTKLSSTFKSRSTSSSSESKVTATATSSAALASYNISKIERLATAATKVNAGKISDEGGTKVDSSKGLYSIRTNFANESFNWQVGSVESESLAVTEDKKTFKLTLQDGVSLQNIATDTSVKVDGKSYQIVTDAAATLTSGQVRVSADGTMEFGNIISKGSSIKVDYTATNKIETFNSTEALKDIQLSKGAISSRASVAVTVNGIEYKNSGTNKNQLLDPITGNVFATFDENGKLSFTNEVAANQEIKVSYQQEYFTFDLSTSTSKGTMNERFLVQGTESLDTVLNKISSSNVGVTAFYDSFSDKVTLTRKETGNFNTAGDEIITSSGFLNDVLGFGVGSTETGGQNAKFTINGLDTERTSNTFEMSGVSFTLKDTLNAITSTEPSVSINISNDSTKVFDNIKNFVDKYNELIDKIQTKIGEERYRTYTPLTDEQRESLTDKQQEQWEDKAKSGLLRRDPLFTSLLTKMRQAFSSPVSGSKVDANYKQMTSIGISTTADYLSGGKLEIDEAKLKKAIEENPEAIEALFTSEGSTTGEKGILTRLYDSVTETMNKVREKAGNATTTADSFVIGKNLTNVDKQIDRFETRLTQIEDRYWRQFTAMEKAIQKANQQSTYLSQQFSAY